MTFTPSGDLRSLHSEWNGSDGFVSLCCPLPGHHDDTPSYCVYWDHAYCFGCKTWVGYKQHSRLFGDPGDSGVVPSHTGHQKSSRTYDAEWLERIAHTYHVTYRDEGKSYFQGRGLTNTTVMEYLLGYTGDAYSIPIWDEGKVVSLKFRRDDVLVVKGPKYWGMPGDKGARLFCPKPLLNGGNVVWCEGELDALLLCQFGYVAVSLTNGIDADPTAFLPRLGGVHRLTMAVDNDRPAYKRSHELALVLGEATMAPVRIVRFPYGIKDVTDLYRVSGQVGIAEVFGATERLIG